VQFRVLLKLVVMFRVSGVWGYVLIFGEGKVIFNVDSD